jgi:hypothetical protein
VRIDKRGGNGAERGKRRLARMHLIHLAQFVHTILAAEIAWSMIAPI